jgi:hypothetical protein
MERQMEGKTDGGKDRWRERQTNRQTNDPIDRQMRGWTYRKNGQSDRLKKQIRNFSKNHCSPNTSEDQKTVADTIKRLQL